MSKLEKYSKKQTYYITNKIYNFLRENPDYIALHKFKGMEGSYDPDTALISLDPRKCLVPTLVHELIHHWHENWTEKEVNKEEDKIMRSLSIKQMKNIIKLLADAL